LPRQCFKSRGIAVAEQCACGLEQFGNGPEQTRVRIDAFPRDLTDKKIRFKKYFLTGLGNFETPPKGLFLF